MSSKNLETAKFGGIWERITDVLGTDKTGEIANMIGVSAGSVSQWKSGGPIQLRNLLRIAKIGGTTVDWLVTGEGEIDKHKIQSDIKEGSLRLTLPEWMKQTIKEEAAGEGRTLADMALQILSEGLQERIRLNERVKAVLKKHNRKS